MFARKSLVPDISNYITFGQHFKLFAKCWFRRIYVLRMCIVE